MEEQSKALVKPETGMEVAALFEQHAMAANRIMDIALSNTQPGDWVSFGGKAWLNAPGAERVGRALGLTVKDWHYRKEEFKDDEGPHYYIICEGKVGHQPLDLWTDAIGICWSRKPFWYKDKERKRHIGEINLGNIIKDAYSDMERNGITRLLGLRGLAWEYLRKYNITEAQAQTVEFKGQNRGTQGKPKPKTKSGGPVGRVPKSGVEDPGTTPPPDQLSYASKEQVDYLCKLASKKVVESDPDKIGYTLPEKLTKEALNQLLKYVADLPGEIEPEEWVKKVREVTA
jgi:hypothetical protein